MLHPVSNSFPNLLSKVVSCVKPIVSAVATLAIGILIYKYLIPVLTNLQERLWTLYTSASASEIEILDNEKTPRTSKTKIPEGKGTPEKPQVKDLKEERTPETPEIKIPEGKGTLEEPKVEDLEEERTPETPEIKIPEGKGTPETPQVRDLKEERTPETPKTKTPEGKGTLEEPKVEDLEEERTPEIPMQDANVSFQDLINKSDAFAKRIKFPTQANLIKNIAKTDEMKLTVVECANATRPVLPARIWSFIPKFIQYKQQYGSHIEQKLYENMTPEQLVDRIIKKRPLAFLNAADDYLLRNGKDGRGGFEAIGTNNQSEELPLEKYQSYDEIQISSFLQVFVPTLFTNKGGRYNDGKVDFEGSFEPKGIYAAVVGARFENPRVMEYPHMVIGPENNEKNGYGYSADPKNPKTIQLRLWAEVYDSLRVGEKIYAFPDYNEVVNDKTGRYLSLNNGCFLDTFVYQQHLSLKIEAFLLEANERAKQEGKEGYVQVVGLGLGVWAIHPLQTELMLNVYADRLKELPLDHISDLNFSWFNNPQICGDATNGEMFQAKGGHLIKIHFSKRDPADKLTEGDEEKLLIAQYAWDSNAFPGNEYWQGMLHASGDPAAACCSLIPELQNPKINHNLRGKYLRIWPETVKV